MYLVLCLRGGGDSHVLPPVSGQPEMGIAAGGAIKQSIVQDPGRSWRKSETKTFNIQILNSVHFRHVTGQEPPQTPIDTQTYARLGYPFYSIYEGPTDVIGDFQDIQSVGQIDGFRESHIRPKVVRLSKEKGNEPNEGSKDGSAGSVHEATNPATSDDHICSWGNHHVSSHSLRPSGEPPTNMPKTLHAQFGCWNAVNPVAEFRDVFALEREMKQYGESLF